MDIYTWGSAHYLVESRSRVELIHSTVDEVNNFVILDVPACDTRVKFRTFDHSKANQPLLPGVSINVPDTAEVGAGVRIRQGGWKQLSVLVSSVYKVSIIIIVTFGRVEQDGTGRAF